MQKQIFINNISWKTSEQGLKNFFDDIGEIEKVKIVFDRATKRSKGFGFITFVEEMSVQKAITEKNGLELDGREIVVEKVEGKK